MPDRSELVVAITRPLLVPVVFRVRSLSRFRHDQPRVSGEHNAPQLLNFFFRSLNPQLQFVRHVIQRTPYLYLTIYYTRAAKRCGDLKISIFSPIRDIVHTGIVRYPILIKKIMHGGIGAGRD